MATISSTLKLVDRFTSPIQKSIDAIDKMLDAMETANSEAMTMDLSRAFHEARSSINTANRSLQEFNRDLDRMDDDPPQNLAHGFGGLSKAIVVANQGLELLKKTWTGISDVMNKADERTSADARLSLINDGLRTQEQLEAQVLKVANDTRSSYASTANLVAQMGRQDFFKGKNDLALKSAETLNKGFVVSGASAAAAEGAITQLTQGIASGVLRGDEFNSVMEQAPVLAEMMAKEFGVTKGQLRAMAEEGMLSSEAVITAIMNQSKAIDEQFGKMPMTFGQGMTVIENKISQLLNDLSKPGKALDNIIQKQKELIAWLDTPDGYRFFEGMAYGIGFVVDGLMFLGGLVVDVYNFFANNWGMIEPIIWGLVAALIVYNATMGIAWLTTMRDVAAKVAHTLVSWYETAAILALIVAQDGLNAALAACPITWIIIAIIVLITVFYVAVAAVNHFAGTSVSATGIIAGVFTALGAHIYNIFAYMWNVVASFVEFFANVFTNPVYATKKLFVNLASNVLDMCISMTDGFDGVATNLANAFIDGANLAIKAVNWIIDALNKIPGVDIGKVGELGKVGSITSSLKNAKKDLNNWLGDEPSNYWTAPKMEMKSIGGAFNAGYNWGEKIEDKFNIPDINKLLSDKNNLQNMPISKEWQNKPVDMDLSKINGDKIKGGKLDKVDKIGDDIDLSKQSLQYLKNIAEIEALKQFEALDAYATVIYENTEAKISKQDKELLMSVAGRDNNIYYLNYQGGVNVKNDIKKGEDWETIKRNLYEETQTDIEVGLSDIEEVVLA